LPLSPPQPLEPGHEVAPFTCGKPALDAWLKTRALRNQQAGFTAVFVVHVEQRVVGYYGLAPTAVTPASMPRRLRTGQPPDPIPCLLLGQLATDRAWSGQGVGSGLLADALRRCLTAAELVGGRAVVVRAIDDDALAYWSRRGFLPSKDDPFTLFRSMQDIAASLAAATP
jgi:predicted N-acetyltransferase YhbS